MNQLRGVPNPDSKSGFTIIEVMLVLAITGLMLIGILGGTYSSIATQRYNDSVRSFSDFLNQLYSEVISPQSLGAGNSDEDAVYGKLAMFGYKDENNNDVIYTATIVGDPNPNGASGVISSLQAANIKLFCGKTAIVSGGQDSASTFDTYIPMWEAKIKVLDPDNTSSELDKAALIIARSPATGVVHTAFSADFDSNLKTTCQPDATVPVMNAALGTNNFVIDKPIDFCIVSDNSRVVRDIRLAADGHNSSAINLIPADGDVKCAQR